MNMKQIKSKLNYALILEELGFKSITQDDTMVRSACALHGGDNPNAFFINKENGLWKCGTKCQRGDDIIALVMEIKKVNFKSALAFVCSISNISHDGISFEEAEEKQYDDFEKWLKNINKEVQENEEFKLVADGVEPISSYKQLTRDVCERFGLAFAKSITLDERISVKNKIIFPIYQNGKMVGASLRATSGADAIKWLHIPKGLKKRSILYNYDNLDKSCDRVFVVEGMTDVMSMEEAGFVNVVGVLGSSITAEQIEKLFFATEVVLCFDGDFAGKKATLSAIEKMWQTFDIYVMDLPEGKDPGSMTSEELLYSYSKKRRV